MGKKGKASKKRGFIKSPQPAVPTTIFRDPPKEPSRSPLEIARTFIGPAFLIAGLSVMATYYRSGLTVVYLGFSLCIFEIWFELAITRLRIRLTMSVVVVAVAVLFSVKVVFSSATLRFDCYAMKNAVYSQGTQIGGILWDDRLTDMKVWVENSSDDDYTDVDVSIRPDQTTYKAAILEGSGLCQLIPIGRETLVTSKVTASGGGRFTAHPEGDHVSVQGDAGGVFEVLLSIGGYRLLCAKLPAHSSIQIVFALAVADSRLFKSPGTPKPGETMHLEVVETTPIPNKFDSFGPRPTPSFTLVDVRYRRGLKPFVAKWKLPVANAN